MKTNLTKFVVISVKRRPKAGFLSPRSSKIILTKEKERRKRKRKSEDKERRRRKKAMVALLVFRIATLEIVFGRKKTVARKKSAKSPARYM